MSHNRAHSRGESRSRRGRSLQTRTHSRAASLCASGATQFLILLLLDLRDVDSGHGGR
jgi:hypothetical protein